MSTGPSIQLYKKSSQALKGVKSRKKSNSPFRKKSNPKSAEKRSISDPKNQNLKKLLKYRMVGKGEDEDDYWAKKEKETLYWA